MEQQELLLRQAVAMYRQAPIPADTTIYGVAERTYEGSRLIGTAENRRSLWSEAFEQAFHLMRTYPRKRYYVCDVRTPEIMVRPALLDGYAVVASRYRHRDMGISIFDRLVVSLVYGLDGLPY